MKREVKKMSQEKMGTAETFWGYVLMGGGLGLGAFLCELCLSLIRG